MARITTLYKDGAHDSRDNDRPISLLSVLSKVMDTCCYILCELSRTQWIAIRSAVSFLWRSLYWVYSNQTDKQNIVQLGPGRSYWNDFCRLWKGILRCQSSTIINLLKALQCQWLTLSWFTSYLSERKQFVTKNGQRSDPLTIKQGVPKTCVLRPILFPLFVNDTPLRPSRSSIDIFRWWYNRRTARL